LSVTCCCNDVASKPQRFVLHCHNVVCDSFEEEQAATVKTEE